MNTKPTASSVKSFGSIVLLVCYKHRHPKTKHNKWAVKCTISDLVPEFAVAFLCLVRISAMFKLCIAFVNIRVPGKIDAAALNLSARWQLMEAAGIGVLMGKLNELPTASAGAFTGMLGSCWSP